MATNGSKYDAKRSPQDTAKAIRSELRKACKASSSPLIGCEISVRFRLATHSPCIDVEIRSAPRNILNPEWVAFSKANPHTINDLPRYNAYGTSIKNACERAPDLLRVRRLRAHARSVTGFAVVRSGLWKPITHQAAKASNLACFCVPPNGTHDERNGNATTRRRNPDYFSVRVLTTFRRFGGIGLPQGD